MKIHFKNIPKAKWRLSDNITSSRRQRLLQGDSFEKIVDRMVREARIISLKRERCDEKKNYFRVAITIEINRETIDLFHNSSCGYRAQYYHGIRNGERANVYIVEKLKHRIMELLSQTTEIKRTCPLDFVEKSLSGKSAKVWIRQGLWLRYRRKQDQIVYAWSDCKPKNGQESKRKNMAFLGPEDETKIELKGAFVTLEGNNEINLKEDRSEHINKYGFT